MRDTEQRSGSVRRDADRRPGGRRGVSVGRTALTGWYRHHRHGFEAHVAVLSAINRAARTTALGWSVTADVCVSTLSISYCVER